MNRAAIALAVVLAAGCSPARTPAPPAADATAPLARRIDSLRAIGRLDAATVAAEERVRRLEAAPRAAAWRRADAARTLTTLRRIATLPPDVQAELARVHGAVARADSLAAAGDPLAAGALLEEQRAVREHGLGPAHEETAASMDALAASLLARGELTRACALARRALEVRRSVLGERHPDVATSHDRLGVALKSAGGSRDEPLAHYRRALALREELLGPTAFETVETLLHLGNLQRVRKEPDAALASFRRVLELDRRAGRSEEAQTANVLFSMAMTVTPEGRWAEAEPWLREAVERGRRVGPSGAGSLGRTLGAHGLALRHLGRLAAAESALVESVRLFEELRRAAPPGWSRAILHPLVAYDFLAAVQVERGHGDAAWRSLESGLARALLEDLSASGAVDTTGWWRDPLARVQAALDEETAFVGWLAIRSGATTEEYPFWCYAIRRHGPVAWYRVDAPRRTAVDAPGPGARTPADAPLDSLRRELVRAASWPLRVSDGPAIRTLARAAYELRLAPLEPSLDGVRRLVVLSADLLHGAPVEAMLDSTDRFLGDRFVVSYAPSALLYARSRATESGRRAPAQWRALLVGDSTLAAGRSEISTLAGRLPGPTLLVGADASAARLHALADDDALAGYQLVHFATHAAIDQTWLGESAFVLGGGPGARGTDRITAPELARRWRLDADLVTLAGCETAVGPATRGEGFLGLQQGLLATGARHLLVSAWHVDDRATELLVERFYAHLLADARGTAAAAEALARARREVRAFEGPDGSRPYAHPIYWAGLVLVDGGLAGKRPPHHAQKNASGP